VHGHATERASVRRVKPAAFRDVRALAGRGARGAAVEEAPSAIGTVTLGTGTDDREVEA
jgi:hypothetical protein